MEYNSLYVWIGLVSVSVNNGCGVIVGLFEVVLSFALRGWVGCVNSCVPLLFLMAKG